MRITKSRIFVLVFVLLVTLCAFALADVAIDEKHFPDTAFRKVVSDFDTNHNGKLSDAEIANVTSIRCEEKGIASLKGLEYFSALETLLCAGNKLTSLDLSGNPELGHLECENNQLIELNVRCCPKMKMLYCSHNKITALDLTKTPCIEWLKCEHNRITSLDFSKCSNIHYAICQDNDMDTLTLKNNNRLYYLYAYGNRFRTLDVSSCDLLDWAVKHGEHDDACNLQGWIADNPGDTGTAQIILYVPSITRVITRVDVTAITLDRTSATLTRTSKTKNPTLQLTAMVTPDDATNPAVEWCSSNPKVAKVDQKGKVTALKKGSAVITCKAKDGSGVKATCKITVKNKLVTKIVLNKKSASLKKGRTCQLKVKTIKPSDAFNKTVTWTTSNKKVATVTKKGLVRAVGKGTCVITCKAKDGSGVKVTCKITVK